MQTITRTRSPLLPVGTWRVDPTRSRVGFAVRKLGAGTVRGRFDVFEGTILIDDRGTAASGTVDVNSHTTGNKDRDRHLRAAGFFAAEEFPSITFRSQRVSRIDDASWTILGRLTIRDRTIDVALTTTAQPAGLRLEGEIDRRELGLTWSRAIEATGVVSPTVRIELELVVA
jgi:polyisoprenoid-binding protein YceI